MATHLGMMGLSVCWTLSNLIELTIKRKRQEMTKIKTINSTALPKMMETQ